MSRRFCLSSHEKTLVKRVFPEPKTSWKIPFQNILTGCGKLRFSDRGRSDTLACIAPPSEPDWRISRIRLSSRWFYLQED